MKDRVYIHKKTRNEYYVHSWSAKVKVGENWYPAVLYSEHKGSSQIYVRTVSDFKEKFEQ